MLRMDSVTIPVLGLSCRAHVFVSNVTFASLVLDFLPNWAHMVELSLTLFAFFFLTSSRLQY